MTTEDEVRPSRRPRQQVLISWAGMAGALLLAAWFEAPTVFSSVAIAAITLQGGVNVVERYRGIDYRGGGGDH